MIKKLIVGVILSVAAVFEAGAGTITWGYSADLGGSYTAGWSVRLYEDVNGDGFGAGFTFGADDVYAGVEDFLVSGKTGTGWGSSFASPAGSLALGDNVYTVIFDNADAALAGNYIIVDASFWNLNDNVTLNDVDATYTLSSVSGTWHAVPEPGTLALLGLGLGAVAMARKRKADKKA